MSLHPHEVHEALNIPTLQRTPEPDSDEATTQQSVRRRSQELLFARESGTGLSVYIGL